MVRLRMLALCWNRLLKLKNNEFEASSMRLYLTTQRRTLAFHACPALKAVQMGILRAAYPWQESYFAALCETDRRLVMGRVSEALSSIDERRLSPVKSERERIWLELADVGIRRLITELSGNSIELEGHCTQTCCLLEALDAQIARCV
jgi:hypothetical protein